MDAREYEKIFYLYLLQNPKYMASVKREFFEVDEVGIIFDISKKFHERFSSSPTKEQVKMVLKKDRFKDKVKDSHIDIIFDEPMSSYTEDWKKEMCEFWIQWKTLNTSLIDTVEFAKTTKVTPDNVKEIINKVKTIINDRNNINFSGDLGKDFFEFESHQSEPGSKISTQHRFIDEICGGYRKKGLICYVGETNIGKSIWLANDAVNFVRSGKNVSVITAEMSDTSFIHRIGANLLDIDISQYEEKSRDGDFVKNRLDMMANGVVPPGKLFVKEYPTSQATVLDIESYLKELEAVNGMKLDVIVIDYVNILCNHRNPNSENTYMKIKQLCEDLRAMAVRNNWVVITASQVNREGYNTSEISLGHVSESAGLSHTCDMIYGIIQTTDMKLKDEYWLKILKIRNGGGKAKKCKYNINYSRMRLVETDEVLNAEGF
jgi:replicative DNA helicase